MLYDRLAQELYAEICRIPLIDPHSHINPHAPTAKTLDDLLNYHYYTELAHSAGMDQAVLAPKIDPRDRARSIIYHMGYFDNTAQYQWFVDIARAFLDFEGTRLGLADCTALWDNAEESMARPDWEDHVLRRTNLQKVFLTNDFDDHLTGFDVQRYVPCLRTDDLVFHLEKPEVRQRLAHATRIDVGDSQGLRDALTALFDHFTRHGAKACAISLPPDFTPRAVPAAELDAALLEVRSATPGETARQTVAAGTFWMLAEHCQQYRLPFDLMIGVRRKVYRNGVPQGQDLFDQRTSLMQYAELFNAFPTVVFPVSVLTSSQNQELVSFSWIFPNVLTSGHWWYSNVPAYIEGDLRARLQAVPKTKQIGYYSDMYKLEFGLPKYNMYRRILASTLADEYVRTRVLTETQAVQLARLLLRDNVKRVFDV